MEEIIQLLNTNAFAGLATIFTGAVAIGVYFYQKRDQKIQAARVLLLEIRTAEERIRRIKEKIESGSSGDMPSVFTTNSWSDYSHLFISDFDQDELALINSFYDYGSSIEDFAKRNNNFFWVTTEERAKVAQQKLADIVVAAKTAAEDNKDLDLETLKNKILPTFVNDPYLYAPQRTLDEIKNYTDKIRTITTTSAGVKLKKLARLV